MWNNYLHDFVYSKLNIHIKQPSFLFDLILAIKEEGDRKSKSTRASDVPYAIAMLHFQFHVKHRMIKTHSSKLILLNEIDMHSEYDSNMWKDLEARTPIDIISNSDSVMLCQYVLNMMYKLFIKSEEDNFCTHIGLWNEIYITMVSNVVSLSGTLSFH